MAEYKELLYTEMNAVCIIILTVILIGQRRKNSSGDTPDIRIFKWMIISNIIIMAVDSAMWCVDGLGGDYMREINLIVTAAYYMLSPLIGYFWAVYSYYKVRGDWRKTKIVAAVISVPVILNTVLSLASVTNGFYFTVDAENVYHRGGTGGFITYTLMCYFYLLLTSAGVLINYRDIKEKNPDIRSPLYFVLFPLPPIIAGLIQACFYGVSLIWSATTLSLLVIFLNMQNGKISQDYLTGIYNRRYFENYLRGNFRAKDPGDDFYCAIIMIDIDNFKRINDNFGHQIGDNALMNAAAILTSCFCERGDILARYGGDEFIAAIERERGYDLERLTALIYDAAERFNAKSGEKYVLEFSVGYEIYDDREKTADEIIIAADRRMYLEKQAKKAMSN